MEESHQEPSLSFEIALKVANEAVFSQTSRHLKNIEVAVLQGAWLGHNYDKIADTVGYAPEYIKHDVGPKLWKILSASFGEKVSKTNLIAVLSQKALLENSSINPSPLKKLDFKAPTGIIPLDSALYIKRYPIESRCYEEIMRSGSLLRIKAPYKMGKTSLMIRILAHAQQTSEDNQVNTVLLNLQRADKAIFSDLDRFLRWFCVSVSRKLNLQHQVDNYWSDTFGSKSNCTAYFEDCILSEIEGVLILALDQVDEVFLHPEIADDFFTLLRSWYEEAAYGDSGNPLWQNLRLLIVHSTEVYIPLDINKSPFNVGLAIELFPFTVEQVGQLADVYDLTLSEKELNLLMTLIGGHPYLTQQALYHLATQSLTIEQFLETSITDEGIYHYHLHRLLQSLQENPPLAEAYRLVLNTPNPIEINQLLAFKLHSMGLVVLQGNQVISSCELYQRYFSDRSIKDHNIELM
ncbi:AAA-like domain-containing protein [Crocosphaera chwakensis]|uniref:vWA-MoxR associated protein N-terminal HTH domain-containing protein n=1 Tax=Crocosphaera chwakensis CCY0110 TaxID=391612 RepID=A3IUX5_9CHRO|nr:AAA-like domain-containing protein [Crocosphaera chwakensis]EAZ89723.1 hypothetical protein CY0110_23251 [Crocosphaera chwakensis CCY0110]